jgi:hypothetical protein
VKYIKVVKTKKVMGAFTATVNCAVFTESGISFVLERFRPAGISIMFVAAETVAVLNIYVQFPIV